MIKFRKVKKIHMVGIGGTGMCGIAEVLWNSGYKVTGSDTRLTDVTRRLGDLGIKIFEGHCAANVENADVLVTSSAVSNGNPEVVFARDRKIPVIRRSEMLGELMRMKFGIGVAGTHGKTTTTSMIGQILSEAGLDPTIVVGGRVIDWESNSKLGEGEYLVAEADEFDRSFLRLTPTVAVITTLEAEHLDYYRDLEEIEDAFLEFVYKVPFYGSVILCADEKALQNLLPKIQKRVTTYGLSSLSDLQAADLSFDQNRSDFKVRYKKKALGELNLKVAGVHNVKNSLAGVAVGLELDIPWEKIKDALDNFQGVNRRLEIKGEVSGILVVDDYAHHPTEIEVSLKALREGWKRRIITVFQPHLFSRTKDFCQEFGRTLSNSDILVITSIYPARERPIPGVSSELIARAAKEYGHQEVYHIPEKEEVIPFLREMLRENDVVITMGAGDIYKIGEELISALSSESLSQGKEKN